MDNDIRATLVDSKLYTLGQQINLLEHFVPNVSGQMAMEMGLEEDRRKLIDNPGTNIFIHFTNSRGNHLSFCLNNVEGLESPFGIDDFLTGYATSIGAPSVDDISDMRNCVTSALAYALGVAIGLERDQTPQGRLKTTCNHVIKAICSALYPNKDVIVIIRDKKVENVGVCVDLQYIWGMVKLTD